MSDTRRIAVAALMLALAALVVVPCASLLEAPDIVPLLVVSSAYAVAGLAVFVLPRGGVAQGGIGVAMAALVLTNPCVAVTSVSIGGALTAMANKSATSPASGASEAARQPIVLFLVWRIAGSFPFFDSVSDAPSQVQSVLGLVGLGLLFVLLELGSFAVVDYLQAGIAPARSFVNLSTMLGSAYLGQVSVAAVLVLVYPTMGLLGVAVLVMLMLVMKHSFSLYLRIHTAYTRTIGVLARLAEFERRETRGHSERVAELAASMGRRMRLSHSDVERLSMAALLHDIGHVRPSRTAGEDNHAQVGARIVSEIGQLAHCASLIELHHTDFQDLPRSSDSRLSQVIRVASDYDILLREDYASENASERALSSLSAESGAKYDPLVLQALQACVLARR